jgi:hypothetical protein
MHDVDYSCTFHLAATKLGVAESAFEAFHRRPLPWGLERRSAPPEHVGPGVFRQRVALGLGTWVEDTITFHPSGAGTDVTYQRRWHAPLLGPILLPAMKVAWHATFSTWHRNLAEYIDRLQQGVA